MIDRIVVLNRRGDQPESSFIDEINEFIQENEVSRVKMLDSNGYIIKAILICDRQEAEYYEDDDQ